jgi:hypothetical protein
MSDKPYNRPPWTVLSKIVARAQAEPVAFQGILQAGLALLIGFGLVSWTSEQTGLALALTAAILTLVARRHVTPNARATSPDPGIDSTPVPARDLDPTGR